jgi:hypothetical protein
MQNQNNQKIIQFINQSSLSQKDVKHFKKLIEDCDINSVGFYKTTIMMHLLKFNCSQKFQFTTEELYKLLQKSNLDFQDKYHKTAMDYLLQYNQTQYLNFNHVQIFSLINKMNNPKSIIKNILISSFIPKSEQYLIQPFIPVWKILTLEEQESIFKKLISHFFHKEKISKPQLNKEKQLSFLLYDCEFPISNKLLLWLKKNTTNDVFLKIQKRDTFFSLNGQLIHHKKTTNFSKI